MSKTSQREDLDDPSTITSFAKKIGDQNRLNYLYVLTPQGISAKTKLTINFMKRKMKEYDELKKELKKEK